MIRSAPARQAIPAQVWQIAAVAMLGPLMTNLDSAVVNVSLATLTQHLHASLGSIQWVVTGYLLALTLTLPLSGWLVDRYGAKRVYIGCFAGFTVASLLCGASDSAAALIAARVLQGMAGGLLTPMAQMMMARVAGRQVARVMGVMVVPVLIGPICGPALGGLILDHAGWRWVFFINLPVGLLATLLALFVLPSDKGQERRIRPLDKIGFMLVAPGLVLLLASLDGLGAGSGDKLLPSAGLAIGVILMTLFAKVELRLGLAALVDLRLFRGRTFAVAATAQFLANGVMLGGQALLPLYLLARGMTPGAAGGVLAATGLGALCSYPAMGGAIERFGPRRVLAGGAVIALAGTAPMLSPDTADWPTAALAALLFLRGIGIGALTLPSISAAYAELAAPDIPVATTALNIAQRLGGPVAITSLALSLRSPEHAGHAAPQFTGAFAILCVFHLLVLVAGLRLPGKPRQERHAAPSRSELDRLPQSSLGEPS